MCVYSAGMKHIWIVAILMGMTGLSACSGGAEQALKSQVQTLTSENVALKAERDALKAQLGLASGGLTQAHASADRTALNTYARLCSTALEVVRLDAPDGKFPLAVNGAGCDSAVLGTNAIQKFDVVAFSRVTLDPGAASGFRVEVMGTNGEQVNYPQ